MQIGRQTSRVSSKTEKISKEHHPAQMYQKCSFFNFNEKALVRQPLNGKIPKISQIFPNFTLPGLERISFFC